MEFKRGTIVEFGGRLPHGVGHTGQSCHQTYELGQTNARTSVAIGKIKNDRALKNWPGQQIVHVVRAMSTEIGGRRLSEMGEREALAFIASLSFVDIINLVYARSAKKRKRATLTIDVECFGCGKPIQSGSSLEIADLPVLYREPWTEIPRTEFELPEPTELGVLGKVSKVWLHVPSWYSTYYDLSAEEFDIDECQRLALVEGAICGTDQKAPERFAKPPKDYLLDLEDEILDLLAGEIANFSGGPIPLLPAKCIQEGCGGTTPIPFSWRESGAY